MHYMTSSEKALEWSISRRRVNIYCKEGRIKGAELKGNMWLIPEKADKPADPRKHKKEQL